jgi:predicted P-loop ATPase
MNTLHSGGGHTSIQALIASLNNDTWEVQFQRYLRFRGTKPGEYVALEAIGPTAPTLKFTSTLLAITNLEPALLHLLQESDTSLQPRGCFIQQNALSSGVSARQKLHDWVPLKTGDGLKKTDVVARRAFYFDFDPVRASNVSSTNAETRGALNRAKDFLSILVEAVGDDAPLGLGFSGNGVQVHVALADLPNSEEVESLVVACVKAADAVMSDEAVRVDTSVTDARRVCPAFGTMKRKGEHHAPEGVPEEDHRPHRRTAFLCHDEVRRLSLDELRTLKEQLEARVPEEERLAVTAPRTFTSTTTPSPKDSPWTKARNVDVEQVSEWLGLGSGANMTCPGCGAAPSSYGRVPGHNLTKCFHDTCAARGMKLGRRGSIELVMEVKKVDNKTAVNLLAKQFGFDPLGKKKAPPPPPPAATNAPWEEDLLRAQNGAVLSTGVNVELVLLNDTAVTEMVGFNALRNGIVFLRPPPQGFLPRKVGDEWQDTDDTACSHWLMQNWRLSVAEQQVRSVVSLVAHRRSFHPVREALDSYAWDQALRVDTWLSTYLGVEDSAYSRTVGRWWLISAVARVMKPGVKVDTMLILEGPQGAKKSSALRALAGDDYFLDDMREVGGVESSKQLRGKWIVELAELDAFRRAESSTIKRFVSQQVDNYRPSYGRTSVDFPRQCVFAGSTNHDEYLHDETGARRFWPVRCGTIDLAALTKDRDQLWAEALVLYRQEQRWWPETSDEEALCKAEQKERQAEDAWADTIREYVADRDAVTTKEVLACALGVEHVHMNNLGMRRVGAALRTLGWERSKASRAKDESGTGGPKRKGPKQTRLFVRGPEAEPKREPKKRREEERSPSLCPDAFPHPTLAKVIPIDDAHARVAMNGTSTNKEGT